MPVDHFGPAVAARYDDETAERFDPSVLGPTVDRLAEWAGAGAALELAVGTGRMALPLAARGVEVHGVDLSDAMVEKLRVKPGGAEVPVTIGDMATVRLGRRFRLVYLVFNSLGNLVTQDEQVACFATAAAPLEPGGCFVIELVVPPLRSFPPGATAVPYQVSDHHIGVDTLDPVTQSLTSHHLLRRPGGSWLRWDVPFRYAWPSELDLMASLAGLSLRHRWAGWSAEPFTAESVSHVSVWEAPPDRLAG